MTEKEMFLNSYKREFEITLKFLKAYTNEDFDFRPYPHAQSAREIAWNFVQEDKALIVGALDGNVIFNQDPIPETLDEIRAAYKSNHRALTKKINNLSDDAFNEMVTFGSGSDHVAPMRRGDVLWLAIMDGAHHRGQFSVYIRMTGGTVPPLYENVTAVGGSGDQLAN